nr:MFS transporter [Mesorhizobium loti]
MSRRQPSGWLRAAFLSSALSGAAGRNGYYLAAAWILAARGFGSAGVAAFLVIASVAEVVSSPVAGMMADRFERRRLNAAAELARSVVVFATGWAMLQLDALFTLCVSAALFSVCDRVALTANQSMIPATGRGRDPVTWNSTVVLTMQFGNLLAALSAGFLLGWHSPVGPFAVFGACFLLSGGLLLPLRLPPALRDDGSVGTTECPIHPGFPHLIAVYALFYASALLISVLASNYVFTERKGSAADFGRLEAAWSAGSLLGATALIAIQALMRAEARHVLILGLAALMFMSLPFLAATWTTVVFSSLGFLYNLGRVSVEVTFQSRVAADCLGRAKGLMHAVAVLLSLIVFGVVAAVGDRAFPSTIFLSFGGVLLVAIFALVVLGRSQQKGTS